MNKLILTYIVLILSIVLAAPLAAQTGNISGNVVAEKDSIPIANATVKIEGTNLGNVADANGNFLITDILPGTYNLVATYPGYEKKTIKKVKVLADKEIMFHILLSKQGLIW